MKKIINIGDMFLTWKVTEYVNPKKYRYKCKCSECGIEKEFVKYNLLKGSYAPCKKCGYKKVSNTALIKKHWNCELNGAIFDTPENFSLTQSYWFICNQGHNFKSNIKDFSLDRCLGCSENPPNHPSKIEAKEYALQYFKAIDKVTEWKPFLLLFEEIKVILYIVENDRYTGYRNYFKSEEEMIGELDFINSLEYNLREAGYDFIRQPIEKNLKNNVDTFKELMLSLICKQGC